MATMTRITLIDDLDGTELDDGAGETVRFGLDGVEYVIDLTDAHARALRRVLTLYVDAARKDKKVVTPGRTKPTTAAAVNREHREEIKAARVWLAGHGYVVKDRGRLPENQLAAYRDRRPAEGWTESKPALAVVREKPAEARTDKDGTHDKGGTPPSPRKAGRRAAPQKVAAKKATPKAKPSLSTTDVAFAGP